MNGTKTRSPRANMYPNPSQTMSIVLRIEALGKTSNSEKRVYITHLIDYNTGLTMVLTI